jgi:hypothetical protein
LSRDTARASVRWDSDQENAGIAAVDVLQARGVASGTVAHTTAKIGDPQDTWDSGVISYLNNAARALGLSPGMRLRIALTELVSR